MNAHSVTNRAHGRRGLEHGGEPGVREVDQVPGDVLALVELGEEPIGHDSAHPARAGAADDDGEVERFGPGHRTRISAGDPNGPPPCFQ